MSLPSTDTVVTFPAGSIAESATVIAVVQHPAGVCVLTDRTPFHPVDPGWPDQGPDRGDLVFDGRRVPLLDCLVGATDGTELFVGSDIGVRRGTPGWSFLVVHVMAADAPVPPPGSVVQWQVDPAHRAALSVGHTACHVAALALNEAAASFWSKPAATDGLGHPDFDQLALASSRIHPDAAVDTYRLGKSLRKRGFDSQGFVAGLAAAQHRANETLRRWVAAGAPVRIETAGPGLSDLRTWVCELPEGTQRIACGGTHLTDLSQLAAITVVLTQPDPAELVMTTTATPVGG